MRKAAKILGWVVAGYVSLSLALDAFIGVTQIALEPGEREGILRTFDADGTMHETRMIVTRNSEFACGAGVTVGKRASCSVRPFSPYQTDIQIESQS